MAAAIQIEYNGNTARFEIEDDVKAAAWFDNYLNAKSIPVELPEAQRLQVGAWFVGEHIIETAKAYAVVQTRNSAADAERTDEKWSSGIPNPLGG